MASFITVIISLLTKVFSDVINTQLTTPAETTIVINNEGPFNIDSDIDLFIEQLSRL